jgi:7-keto-8-aminopelargonate synthetase-like enzyme
MMGDGAPIKELVALMNKYEQFHVYADDAHGTSWTGKNGVGYVLNQSGKHEKLYLGMSMSKGFGVGGGLMVYPDKKIKELVKNLGTSMVFSGPPHPGIAAAAIKSAEIHMRAEFADWQLDLKMKIEYFWKKAYQLDLPLSGNYPTPIFYVVLGSLENVFFAASFLLQHGAFVDTCSYPSVPMHKSGIRMTISRFISVNDIDNLLESLSEAVNKLEKMGKLDKEKIRKHLAPKLKEMV